MGIYPHMCRDDHAEIGHRDSEHEQCPLCRAIAALQFIADGYDNHDVNHVDYRVKAYQVATETIEELRASKPTGEEGERSSQIKSLTWLSMDRIRRSNSRRREFGGRRD